MESCAAGSEADSVDIACERGWLLEMGAASCIETDSSGETWAGGLVVVVSGQDRIVQSQGHLKAVIPGVGAQCRRQNPWRRKNRVRSRVTRVSQKKRLVMRDCSIHIHDMMRDDPRIRVYTMNLCSKKSLSVRKKHNRIRSDMGGSLNDSSVSTSFQETAQVAD